MMAFTEIEQRILNRIQKDFKITPAPFAELASEIGIEEGELLNTVKKLKDDGIIRDISAIFNAGSLGYHSTLIAFEVSDKNVESASKIISADPGVSHNYLRNHRYNIWFTLMVCNNDSLEKKAALLAEKCQAGDYLILKNEKLLKIGLILDVGDIDNNEDNALPIRDNSHNTHDKNVNKSPDEITEEEKKAVYLLQMDMPLSSRPFQNLIDMNNIEIDEKRLVEIGEAFKKGGIMRRYSAILKHQKAGYNYNAMTAWMATNIEDKSDIIKMFTSVQNISHLYMRTVFPGRWEHPLFAMIHAKSEEELSAIIKDIEKKSGIKDYLILNTLKEFKKERVKYFTEKFKQKD